MEVQKTVQLGFPSHCSSRIHDSICFPKTISLKLDSDRSLWHFIVCAFEEGGTASSLYRLALAGKAFHQSACPEILDGPSGSVCSQTCCWSP